MALANITNWTTLNAAIAEMAHRAGSSDVTGSTPTAIQLLEAELNDELLLKDMESDESLTLSISANFVALPTGFVSPIKLWLVISSERYELPFVEPEMQPYISTNGLPTQWAVDAANVRFDRPADVAYAAKLRCIKSSNLSAGVTTNALLLKRPDVYLYGGLKHLAIYLDDDRNLQKWSSMYEQAKKKLMTANARSRTMVPVRSDYPVSRASFNIYRGD